MNPLPSDRATTLKQAYRNCTPEPLRGADIDKYYVDLSSVRNTEAIQSVITKLEFLEPSQFCSILFTGHRGCGKSTELKKIEQRLKSEFYTIYLEADVELDINDAEYTDLYLLIIKKVADELYKIGAKFDSKLLASFESWFKNITQETEESVEKAISSQVTAKAGFEIPFISKLSATLLARIKGSQKQKQTIRQTLQKDISRLQADINLLLADAFSKLEQQEPQYEKGFLIILDNLDRIPPNVGNHLFFDYAAQLQGLNTTIIYTAPISAVYSDKNINKTFGSPNIMPMVNIYQFNPNQWDLEYKSDKLEAFARLIEQRVDIDAVFVSRQQLLDLVKASGGHVRQLMQITAKAFLTAAGRGHDKVTAEDITYAVNEEQFNFERITLNEYYSVLAKVCLTKNIDKDEVGQLLLFNLSVLEYNGDNRWNYINPIFKQSSLFQSALQNEQQQS
ncbi:MAG: P-loop NTPase fold protein [Cyanobacteria bacterium J06621_8]